MKTSMRFTDDALKYKGEWVAFSIDYQRVVGHGATGKEARAQAKRDNEPHAILLFIPEEMPDIFVF